MSEGLAEGNLKRNQDGSDEDRGQRQAADVSRFRAGRQVLLATFAGATRVLA